MYVLNLFLKNQYAIPDKRVARLACCIYVKACKDSLFEADKVLWHK